jgi:Tat protein secretion system quality control protein TatD with DNase activity
VSKLSPEEQEEALARLLPALDDPVSLRDSIESQRRLLLEFPNAMVGEVGLDRQARIPHHSRGEGPDRLSPFKTPVEHQMAILEAQLDLAVELRRNVSLHSVDAQSLTVGVLKRMKEKHGDKWLDISVDMHSCGLSVDTWRSVEVSSIHFMLAGRRFRTECESICRKRIQTRFCHCLLLSTVALLRINALLHQCHQSGYLLNQTLKTWCIAHR